MRLLRTEMEKRLSTAAEVICAEAVRSIRTPYPPASTPGQPPHTRSGASGLMGSVFYWVNADTSNPFAVVGTSLKYGLYLELGTYKMAARPWLRPALYKTLAKLKAIMTKPLPRR
ncbi:MAG TPA: hypothetical protein VG826_29520 [Pirellulales bacterium]|nr:hypothetical protein [Pirellulales bacterium]